MLDPSSQLIIDRRVVVLDLETTGTNYQTDRIVQLAALAFEPGKTPQTFAALVDPGIPIPPDATAVHGIRDEDVKNATYFAYLADDLREFLEGAALVGYNLKRFDLPLLAVEFARCGLDFSLRGRLIVDAFQIFREMEPRELAGALRFFCGRTHEGAHGAEADVVATAWVLDGQLARYPELPRTLEELHERFATPDLMGKFRRAGDDLVFAFGKHRGRRLSDVAASDPDYLRWMREEGDFLEDVPQIVSAWLEDAASPQDVHS